MPMRRLPVLNGLLLAFMAMQADAAGAGGGHLQLVDDRGLRLASPVEACFQVELSTDCARISPEADLTLPPVFGSVRIEGPDYGPVSLRQLEIARLGTDGKPLQIPRKATLRVESRGEAPSTVSLYRLDEPDLRRAAFRLEIPAAEAVKVPAGEFLVSISRRGSAPVLHLVTFVPGGRSVVRFTARPGWSLALRVMDSRSGKPVAGAGVELRGTPGYSSSASRPLASRTTASGFALFSGLTDALMTATVRHSEYVARDATGLLASPGSFAYQAAGLEAGGRIRATVTKDGRPAAGADCEVARYVQHPVARDPSPEILFRGATNAGGVCTTAPLAAGAYILQVSIPGKEVRTAKGADVFSGEVTPLDVSLEPIRVRGKVRLGADPAQGFQVVAYNEEAVIPNRTRKDGASLGDTNEDGEYEGTLWSAGKYTLSVTTPVGTPAAAKRSVLLSSPEEVVDFQLDGAGISGVVVDEAGEPVEGATVVLRWRRAADAKTRVARPGADGVFQFPMEDSGAVVLQAYREGWRSSDPLSLEFVAGRAPAPVRLVLTRERTLSGAVFSAAGIPVAGAWVATYTAGAGGLPLRAGSTVTGSDGAFEVPLAQGAVRVFVSGPGCPLLAADMAPPGQETRIVCAAAPAALSLEVEDRAGKPVAHANFILRRQGQVFPRDVLAMHLGLLQLPAETDGTGHLVIPGIAPGDYDVFLATSTSEDLAALGTAHGYLGSFSLAPLNLTEVEAQVDADGPIVQAPPGE